MFSSRIRWISGLNVGRNRGIFGVRAHNINEKTGKLASIGVVTDDKDIIAITNEGVVIRTSVSEIPVYNRSATGVKVMKLDKNAKIAKMSFTDSEKEEEVSEVAESPTDITPDTKEVSDEATEIKAEITDTPTEKTEE